MLMIDLDGYVHESDGELLYAAIHPDESDDFFVSGVADAIKMTYGPIMDLLLAYLRPGEFVGEVRKFSAVESHVVLCYILTPDIELRDE